MQSEAQRLAEYSTATVFEASKLDCMLPPSIKPLDPDWRLCGPALTVDTGAGNNLWIHRAIYQAQPGTVLVAASGGAFEYGYWGEIMSTAALCRGLGGLVIDGSVRDLVELRSLGLPVFARGLCIKGTGKSTSEGLGIGAPILVGDVTVRSGDVMHADCDGVVAIPSEVVATVADRAAARVEHEQEVLRELRNGASTLDLYGWA